MTNLSNLINGKRALPNIRFWDDEKKGNNIIFVPESLSIKDAESALIKFMNTQVNGYYQQITIPGIISNFSGKKLSNQKYYLNIKKELPNFIFNRIPGKQLSDEKTNIFDLSGIITDIMITSKSRSQKKVFSEFIKLTNSILKDYPIERKNILYIYGNSKINMENSDFLNFLHYIFRINNNKIKTMFDGIVYSINNKYYPIAVPDKEGENLILLKNILNEIKQLKSNDIIPTPEQNENAFQVARDEITTLTAPEKLDSTTQKKIKKIIHNLNLVGTFQEKLEMLFKEDLHRSNEIKKLTLDINKKYNGTISVNIPKNGIFDYQKIVGLDELGNYDKQRLELAENIDELIEDLIYSTLGKDPDLKIDIKNIKTKIVDDNKNRYKEYQIKIQHKDFGNTTNRPYTISFRVPVPVQGKYIKLGGNNHILINQLFPKPIQKIAPNLVRFYTHYSVASLAVKNTKLSAGNSFNEIEEKFIQQMKSIGAASELSSFDNSLKDELSETYNIPDLKDFKYKKIVITA